MRRRRLWLEIGTIIVAIALVAAWTRPKMEEQDHRGLRFLGRNAKGFEEYENVKDGTVLIKIPGCTFTMGTNDGRDVEGPAHRVTLPPYLLARTPVTNAQFARFVSAAEYGTEDSWRECASNEGNQAPVVFVSQHNASAYCKWAGLRLPTEEEWELAARGTESYAYPWGNKWNPIHYKSSAEGAVTVGSFPSGASPFGCLDMVGCEWQWTSSSYDAYPGNTTSKRWAGTKASVLRGPSWYMSLPEVSNGCARIWSYPSDRSRHIGFRCARSL